MKRAQTGGERPLLRTPRSTGWAQLVRTCTALGTGTLVPVPETGPDVATALWPRSGYRDRHLRACPLDRSADMTPGSAIPGGPGPETGPGTRSADMAWDPVRAVEGR